MEISEISTNYHQQRNDVLPLFFNLIIREVPVKRTCEILKMSPTTYYGKLEWIYKRCLEFLERNEEKAFAKARFDRMWLNTDNMVYNLNNIRKRGKGGNDFDDVEDKLYPTHITWLTFGLLNRVLLSNINNYAHFLYSKITFLIFIKSVIIR